MDKGKRHKDCFEPSVLRTMRATYGVQRLGFITTVSPGTRSTYFEQCEQHTVFSD